MILNIKYKMKICIKFRKRIAQLSFKIKLAISFGICCFFTLLIMNVVLQVLQTTGQQDNILIANNENQQFINISNQQMLESFTAIGLGALDRFDNIIFQLSRVYQYFQNNPDSYFLKNTSKYLLYTKDFSKVSYMNSAIYLYSQNSTIHRDQYMDVYMRSISQYVYPGLRRVNIIYYHTDNPNDLMARTYPATSDFIIKSPEQIAGRLDTLRQGLVELTPTYYDKFSIKQGIVALLGLRTVVASEQKNVRVLIEVEIFQASLSILMRNIYYFPSTNINFVAVLPNNSYKIMSQLKPDITDLTDFLSLGVIKKTLPNGTNIIGATLGVDKYHKINSFSRTSRSNDSEYRFIVLSDASDSNTPFVFMQYFSTFFSLNLSKIFYLWAAFLFILICAASISIGQKVFIQLTNLGNTTNNYIKNPNLFQEYIEELRCSKNDNGELKQLVENYRNIIEKIEKNKAILKIPNKTNSFSLSMLEVPFQKRIGLSDYQIMNRMQQQLTNKQVLKNNIR